VVDYFGDIGAVVAELCGQQKKVFGYFISSPPLSLRFQPRPAGLIFFCIEFVLFKSIQWIQLVVP